MRERFNSITFPAAPLGDPVDTVDPVDPRVDGRARRSRPAGDSRRTVPSSYRMESGEDLLHALISRHLTQFTACAIKPAQGAPAVRAEEIARIRSSIASGTYRVSAADLAQSLIAHMLHRPD